MSFPLGRPILAILASAVIAGAITLFRPSPPRADLTLWVTADLHARLYEGHTTGPSLLQQFQTDTGKTVRLDLISAAAMDVRLLSLFMFVQGNNSNDLAGPDVVEISLGSIGKYLRPSANEIGFLPLNDYLKTSGWMPRLVQSRLAPWSKDGIIFGIPHDLHPCTLTYRKDLFDQAGIDPESATTWQQLQERCLVFQQYWQAHGHRRTALGLSSTGPDMLMVMLRQQHVELIDSDLRLHLSDEKTVSTLCWYARAVAGPQQIARDLNPAAGQSAIDLCSGDTCGLITPDWMVADLKQFGPELAGKLRMMALPRFSADDARTASWGGTMIGITRTCRQPDLAWKLIEHLYLDAPAIAARQRATGIIPPIPQYFSDPVYHQPDPFYGGQKIDELFIQLAGELPRLQMTPYTAQAQIFLAIALNEAVAAARAGTTDLPGFCRQRLQGAQARLSSMIQFDRSGMQR